MNIVGISAYYHDAAACIVKGGKIVAAAQEERFSRKKHDPSFPVNAITYCLKEACLKADEIDFFVFYDKPFLKFERLLETYLAFAPKGFKMFSKSLPVWVKDKLFQKSTIIGELKALFTKDIDFSKKLLFSEHHLSHAASAFFPSPFEEAAILTMDGVGEWSTTSVAIGKKNKLEIVKEIHFPHSLGLLYSALTYYLGFKVNSGEYKVMGLAPYGEPIYANTIKDNLIDIRDDGSFFLNMEYFNYATGLTMVNKRFEKLFESAVRKPESSLTQKEMDLAASIQSVTEEVVLKISKNIAKETKSKNLCLAGGVALNCVANGKLARENIFDDLWVQPASGDAGGALGAALAVNHLMLEKSRRIYSLDAMQGSYLGPQYTQSEIEKRLKSIKAVFRVYSQKKMLEITAKALSQGKAIGWHQGRMEFGPRSLGSRSIIADPRANDMQKKLNLKVKFRESFRPFAPSILEEFKDEWFDLTYKSPYMLFVATVKKDKRVKNKSMKKDLFGIDRLNVPKSQIPAVTHVDFSARVQTVSKSTNALYYKLIEQFYHLTGCPVLVNTSFNIRGEPIVSTPEDAFKCFMGTDLDFLVIGNCILDKNAQKQLVNKNYSDEYELD